MIDRLPAGFLRKEIDALPLEMRENGGGIFGVLNLDERIRSLPILARGTEQHLLFMPFDIQFDEIDFGEQRLKRRKLHLESIKLP